MVSGGPGVLSNPHLWSQAEDDTSLVCFRLKIAGQNLGSMIHDFVSGKQGVGSCPCKPLLLGFTLVMSFARNQMEYYYYTIVFFEGTIFGVGFKGNQPPLPLFFLGGGEALLFIHIPTTYTFSDLVHDVT